MQVGLISDFVVQSMLTRTVLPTSAQLSVLLIKTAYISYYDGPIIRDHGQQYCLMAWRYGRMQPLMYGRIRIYRHSSILKP
jgi:hypothetical protein